MGKRSASGAGAESKGATITVKRPKAGHALYVKCRRRDTIALKFELATCQRDAVHSDVVIFAAGTVTLVGYARMAATGKAPVVLDSTGRRWDYRHLLDAVSLVVTSE